MMQCTCGCCEDDFEPNWDDLKQVHYACGHPGLADRMEDDPGPEDVCWNCQPCSCCGEKFSDCACPAREPFAEEETAEEARARMTPEEVAADRTYLEGKAKAPG